MKYQITLFLLLIVSINVCSQNIPKAFFNDIKDTVVVEIGKDSYYEFTINSPPQTNFHNTKVEFFLIHNEFSVDFSNIYLPNEKFITIDSTQEVQKKFKIKLLLKDENPKLLKIGLKAILPSEEEIILNESASIKNIYIKPILTDTAVYEFWFFLGANLNFFDLVKPDDFYFKGTYYLQIREPFSVFVTFGKNKFYTNTDSLKDVEFSSYGKLPSTDSFFVVRGKYNTVRKRLIDNIFLSFDGLYKITSNTNSQFSVLAGVYYSSQIIQIEYHNIQIIETDTFYSPTLIGTSFQTFTMPRNLKIEQSNFSVSVGIFHVLTTDDINIKTQFSIGMNNIKSVYRIYEFTNVPMFLPPLSNSLGLFSKVRIDATVLNPGISLGFEMLHRESEYPLFNVSLSKVVDIEQLGNLFKKVSPSM